MNEHCTPKARPQLLKLRRNIRRRWVPIAKHAATTAWREILLPAILTKPWTPAVPAILGASAAAIHHLDMYLSAAEAYLLVTLCILLTGGFYAAYHINQVEPACHKCNRDRLDCWANLALHHQDDDTGDHEDPPQVTPQHEDYH